MRTHKPSFRFVVAAIVAALALAGCATHHNAKPRIAPDAPGATMVALASDAPPCADGRPADEPANFGHEETST